MASTFLTNKSHARWRLLIHKLIPSTHLPFGCHSLLLHSFSLIHSLIYLFFFTQVLFFSHSFTRSLSVHLIYILQHVPVQRLLSPPPPIFGCPFSLDSWACTHTLHNPIYDVTCTREQLECWLLVEKSSFGRLTTVKFCRKLTHSLSL